jgi:predicted ATPase/signal transduction histidine kinase
MPMMFDRQDHPGPATPGPLSQGTWLQHEQQILERLASVPGVPGPATTPWAADAEGQHRARGITLADALHRWSSPAVPEQVAIALELAGILTAVHKAGVTHGDLNPDNVLLTGTPPRIMLIGFGQATTVAEREAAFSHHDTLAGTLATLAPEQTGRTGRPCDQRADLYGLGVTLYHLATGALPFEASDPLRLVHEVLARMPEPPADRAKVPQLYSEMIMRLLQKEPDQRYQSAEGLAYDLRQLHDRIRFGQPLSFPLGEQDFPHRLSAPSRLVGRAPEIAALRTALEGAVAGTCKAALVSGAPGVGKTVLINELRPMVTALGGWFVSGKSDQYRRDLASDAVSQTLRALGRLLLTEPEADLLGHRARLLETLGGNAGLLASAQPELALVLGFDSAPAPGDEAHAKDRLARAAMDALRAIASPRRPLVVVLDDLQWASETATSLLETLFQEEPQPGLLLVGAWRHGEISAKHPLSTLMPRWTRSARPPVLLRPQNLPPTDLSTMLAEMLRLPAKQAMTLAAIVEPRTGGNPFDTVTLLNAMREEGALARDDVGWWWDESMIQRQLGEGDVVDLLERRIGRLPEATGEILSQMACLGGETDADLLCLASGSPAEVLESHLAPALEDGLLVIGQGGEDGTTAVVKFRHDRVQQAATSRLSSGRLRALHLELARRLARDPRYVGLAAEHYLPVIAEVVDAEERRGAFHLFRAAAGTLRLVNPAVAERFLAAALSLLDGEERQRPQWGPADGPAEHEASRRRRITVEISHHAALYQLGRLAEADARYQSIERLNPSPLEIVDAVCDRISSLTFRDRPAEGVRLGLDLLRRLGVEVPADEQIGPWIERGMARLRAWTAEEDGLAADLARPEASDPYAAAAARLIARMIPPSFFVGMPIMPWLMLECQRLWAEHGPCAALVGPLCHASFVTIMLEQDCRTGYDAVRRVIAVSEKHGYEPECSHAKLIFALSSGQWFEPLENIHDLAQRALAGLLQGGDQQNVGFAGYVLIPGPLECTPTLADYLSQVNARLEFATSSGNDQTYTALVGYRQLAKALLGQTDEQGSLADATFDPAAHLATNGQNPVAMAYNRLALAVAAAIFGDSGALAEHTLGALAFLPVYEATLSTVVVRVLRALALAETIRRRDESTPEEIVAAEEELDRCRQWLAQRAANSPVNFEHLLHFVDAERAWARGELLEAARAFDAAMASVRGKTRPWHAALITERAALLQLEHGLTLGGGELLARARDLYQRWGAVAKVEALHSAYPGLPEPAPADPEPRERPAADPGGSAQPAAGPQDHAGGAASPGEADSRTATAAETIDTLAVLQVCQVLSSETNLARLHLRVKEVLGAATGATGVRVVLRRDDAGDWFVPTMDADGVGGQGIPLSRPEGARLVPLLAFRYAERTLEPVLVADVARDARFTVDPYVRKSGCRSLLVMPILSHGSPRAMLILEHNLSRGAFTTDRLDAVRLIAGQLAVSLENAMLYEELEDRVHERTRELHATQNELVSIARNVSLAETASHVLHALGTVLTSVNLSADLVAQRLRTSTTDGLARAVGLLRSHGTRLGEYLTTDEEGARLPDYLVRISTALIAERHDAVDQMERLVTNLGLIADIIAAQQPHPSGSNRPESTNVTTLLEDAVRINTDALHRHQVTIVRRFGDLPIVLLDKLKVLLILVNLISNARAAVTALPGGPRLVVLSADLVERGALRIVVEDSGEGIRPEHLSRLFTEGFSTRNGGHGFGLYRCALAAREMGGALTVTSDGPGRGARFTLDLPVRVAPA